MNQKTTWPLTIYVAAYFVAKGILTTDPAPAEASKYITVRFLRAPNETEPSSAEVQYLNTIPERTTTDPKVWDLPSVRRLIYLLHKTRIYHDVFRRWYQNEDDIIHIINPVESKMPGNDISIKLIKEILEKKAFEMVSLPTSMSTKHQLERFKNVTVSETGTSATPALVTTSPATVTTAPPSTTATATTLNKSSTGSAAPESTTTTEA